MRALACTAAALLLLAGAAHAQAPAPGEAHKNPAIKDPDTTGELSAGANSFTKGQAEERMKKAGYTGITGLAKDKDGIWRAQAMKDGKKTGVSLDFKGNVSGQ